MTESAVEKATRLEEENAHLQEVLQIHKELLKIRESQLDDVVQLLETYRSSTGAECAIPIMDRTFGTGPCGCLPCRARRGTQMWKQFTGKE